MVLLRLLGELPPEQYVLISRERYAEREGTADAPRLAAKHHHLLPTRRMGIFGRFRMEYLDELVNAVSGILDRARQIARIAREERCDLLIGCSGDLYDLPATRLAGRRTRIPVVPYLFDDYVYQWTGARREIARRLEPFVMRGAQGPIVPNEYLGEEYRRRHGVRPTVIRNPCILPDLDELDRRPPAFDRGPASIVYTGAVYRAHYDAFRSLVEAIGRTGRTDVRLHIFTAQPPGELSENGISGPFVAVHPHVVPGTVPSVLRQADVLFLPLAFRSPIPEAIRTSAPGKTGEYLSVGRPILVHAPEDSFVSWYFRENRCGLVVDRSDPVLLSASILRLLSDGDLRAGLAVRARSAAEKDFEVGAVRIRFEEALRAFAGRR